MKLEKDRRIPVRLERPIENMIKDRHLPRHFEKGAFGVIMFGFENPESYHVQFFEGDEPIMGNYLGFGLVKPEDINKVVDE